MHTALCRIWNDVVLPTLIPQPKWYTSSPELKVDDVVYFRKSESDLDSKWTVGQVDTIERSKDGAVRRAKIRYYNYGENNCRFTDRCVRSLVRLFNIEDNYWINDISKCEMLVKDLQRKAKTDGDVHGSFVGSGDRSACFVRSKNCSCCCESHCNLSKNNHVGRCSLKNVTLAHLSNAIEDEMELEFPYIYEADLLDNEEDYEPEQTNTFVKQDPLSEMITAMETNFNLD